MRAASQPASATARSSAEAVLPRRARPPWMKPDVLVFGDDLPPYARTERGFHLLTREGLRQLAEAPPGARGRRARPPNVAVADFSLLEARDRADLSRVAAKGFAVVEFEHVAVPRCRIHSLGSPPQTVVRSRLRAVATRVLDLALALLGTALMLAVLPFVAVALWLEDRGPVFYLQERVGRHGRVFKLVKFRSMRPDAEAYGPAWARVDDDRVTRVGKVLRRYKIDELPQFLNVLSGSMSIVGPRPERPFFVGALRRHIPAYDLRHSVRPGLTGWGTLRVGYGNSIEAKHLTHQYDLYHLMNGSIWFDLEIMFKSIRAMVLGSERLDRFML